MGLKHLTLDGNVGSPDWAFRAANGVARVTTSRVENNLLEKLDDSNRPIVDKEAGHVQYSQSSDPDELDDALLQEFLSFEEDTNSGYHNANGSLPNDQLDTDLESFLTNGLDEYFGPKKVPTCVVGAAKSNAPKTPREMARERRKKDEHNVIERRRRYHINDRIKELATLLPKKWREEMKLNKGTILKASVDYIRVLNRNQTRVRRIIEQTRCVKLEHMEALKRLSEMETVLKMHGISVPDANFVSLNSSPNEVQEVRVGYDRYGSPKKIQCLASPWDTMNRNAANGHDPINQNSDQYNSGDKNLKSPITPLERNFDCESDIFAAQNASFNFATIFLDC